MIDNLNPGWYWVNWHGEEIPVKFLYNGYGILVTESETGSMVHSTSFTENDYHIIAPCIGPKICKAVASGKMFIIDWER